MRVDETWNWLRTSPLLWLFVTVAAYEFGRWVRKRSQHPLAQPTLVAIVVCGILIELLHVRYADYYSATSLITFLLGPATVALAVPLHRQFRRLKDFMVPMLAGLIVGAVVSVGSGILLVKWLGGGDELSRTMAPKAATTPVSIALADRLGGIPELAAVFAIIAGILGAIAGPSALRLIRVRDPRTQGLAIGAVSHGIGTARMLHDDPLAGAFSGLAMCLTAVATCLIAPLFAAALL